MGSNGLTSGVNTNKLIEQFVRLRDKKRELEKRQEAELAKFQTLLDEIESRLLQWMDKNGVDNVSGPGGTAYRSIKPSATIRDGQAFREFVIDQQLYDLVDWRANAKAVFDYIREKEDVPPGLNTSQYMRVNFRRPTEKE